MPGETRKIGQIKLPDQSGGQIGLKIKGDAVLIAVMLPLITRPMAGHLVHGLTCSDGELTLGPAPAAGHGGNQTGMEIEPVGPDSPTAPVMDIFTVPSQAQR